MAIGVIADLVSLSNNPIYRLGVSLNPISDHEERRFDLVFRKNIKQLVGVRRIRSIVVGERYNPLVCFQANDIPSERWSKEQPQQHHRYKCANDWDDRVHFSIGKDTISVIQVQPVGPVHSVHPPPDYHPLDEQPANKPNRLARESRR